MSTRPAQQSSSCCPASGRSPPSASSITSQHHPIKHPSQLMRIKGIGRKTYNRIKPYLVVEGETTLRVASPAHRRRVELPRRGSARRDPAGSDRSGPVGSRRTAGARPKCSRAPAQGGSCRPRVDLLPSARALACPRGDGRDRRAARCQQPVVGTRPMHRTPRARRRRPKRCSRSRPHSCRRSRCRRRR